MITSYIFAITITIQSFFIIILIFIGWVGLDYISILLALKDVSFLYT